MRELKIIPLHSPSLCILQYKGPQIFQKCRSHLKILGARKVTYSRFHTEAPQYEVEVIMATSGCGICVVLP